MNAPLNPAKKAEFAWHDPLLLERSSLSRAHGARCRARISLRKLAPRVWRLPQREARSSLLREMARSGSWTHASRRIRRRRHQLRELRADRARARARGFGIRSTMSVQSSLVMTPIHDSAPSAKEEYLRSSAKGADRLLRLDRAQPRLRPGEMETRAKKVPGGYSLRGSKTWISQRADRRSVSHLGEDRGRTHPRLPRRKRREGLSGPRSRQSGPAHLDHRRRSDGRGVRAGENLLPASTA